ncbi:MAG: fused MFS/spermidine synthase [Proteobacteria bacterium]|nr:fused MFS/spermidine synthase [Pseudomonadota bacterium]
MPQLVLVAFVLSGISGITLEIVWTRQPELVFGATTLAISTVLTCFMGGLALGSWVFGKVADRLRSPLLGYAVLEAIIGASALAIPWLIRNVYPDVNGFLVTHLGNSFWLFSLCRFLAVAIVLIVPTTCMGATLPILSRHYVREEAHLVRVSSRVGALYTLNTVGAIVGVFCATFILLPTIGLIATNTTAAVLDLAIAAAIILFARRLDSRAPEARSAGPVEEEGYILPEADGAVPFVATPAQRTVAVAAFFVSGLAAMNLQVVWNRVTALVIGSSVYSFALVLLAFLVGLAGGAAVFSRLSKRLANPVIALAAVEIAIAALAALSYLYIDDLPRVFAHLVTGSVDGYEEHVVLVQSIMFAVAALAVLPVTIGMGATFPLTIRVAAGDLGKVGRDVGSVYAMNTLGSILGSFLAAFAFVPLFSHYGGGIGMQIAFLLSIALYAVLAVALVAVSRVGRLARAGVSIAVAAGLAALLFAAPRWDPASLTIGVFRISLMEHALDEESWGDPDVMYYYDGVTTTVSVEIWGRHFSMKNNGKVDASNGDDMTTQILVAAYPILFHPAGPEDLDVAIVGFGSGVTVGAALEFPLRRVDCIELESAVMEASVSFGHAAGAPSDPDLEVNHLEYRSPDDPAYDWTDPETFVDNERLTIFNNDGRNFLATAEAAYDVIISEPSNPWITGVANMFTAESFASSARALKPGGVFGQWVQLYEMSPENIKTILRTFAGVFPHVVLLATEDLSSDTVLLGSFSPIEFDVGRMRRVMRDPRVAAELRRAYVFEPTDIFARALLVDRRELLELSNGKDASGWSRLPVNTDDNARIEFAAPHDLITFSRFSGYIPTFYAPSWPYSRVDRVLTGLGDDDAAVGRSLARQALSLLGNGRKSVAKLLIARAEPLAPGDREVASVRRIADLLAADTRTPRPRIEPPQPSIELQESDAAALAALLDDVQRAVDTSTPDEALERFHAVPEYLIGRGGPQLELLRGYLSFLGRDPQDKTRCEKAIETLDDLQQGHPEYAARHPEIDYLLGMCHDNARHFDKAVKSMSAYVARLEEQERLAGIAGRQEIANAAASRSGVGGTAVIDLPEDAPGAPTADAPGESPKDVHEDSAAAL